MADAVSRMQNETYNLFKRDNECHLNGIVGKGRHVIFVVFIHC